MNLHAPVVTYVLLLFVTLASSQPYVKVYIGYDINTFAGAVVSAQHLFNEEIYYTESEILDLSNVTQVTQAMQDMDVLFLTSGSQDFLTDMTTESLIESFVSSGGILIYSADSGNLRSDQVSIWLGDPTISVTAVQASETVNQYYADSFIYRNFDYGPYGYDQYLAAATNVTLGTSFAASGRFHTGYNFQSFAPNLYWINGYNRGMLVNAMNRNYCMFLREGYYGLGYHDESCFLFTFPHGSGYAVELSADFSSMGIFYSAFTNTTIRAIEGAIRLNRPMVTHPESVIISDYGNNYNLFVNVIYDLAQDVNVYLWHSYNVEELYDLIELTGANTIIVDRFRMESYGPPYFANGNAYYDFIINGGRMVMKNNFYIHSNFSNNVN